MAEYSGIATGWVKERFLKNRRVLPVLTVAAEAANARVVSIQLRTPVGEDGVYVDIEEAVALKLELMNGNGVLVDPTDFTISLGASGTLISADDQAVVLLTTTAAGVASVTVTDVVGGVASTLFLVVTPLNVPGFPAYADVSLTA